MATSTYNVATDAGKVRLLVCDISSPWVFKDDEIEAFLALESGNIKRAAATAIDTNASNEALASKVITTQDVATDGAKLAAAMHAIADGFRAQALADEEAGAGFYFDVIDVDPTLIVDPDFPDRSWLI